MCIRDSHIVGINSITVQTGDSLSVHKSDGSLIRTIVSNTGVSTFHAIEVSKGGGDLSVGISTLFADNSTGRIGIGTDIPDSNLHIWSHSNDTRIEIDSQGFKRNNYIGVTGADNLEIAADEDNLGGDSSIRFRIDAGEKVRITSAGDVGISTAAPASKLHLYDAASDGLILQSPSGLHYIWAIQAAGNLNNGSLAGELAIRGQSGVSISANNGTGTQLRLTSEGRLMLGTATEGQASADDLTIATSGATGITIRSGTSSNGNLFFSDGTSGADEYRGVVQYNHTGNFLRFYTNGAEKLRITSDGFLGISTASVLAPFHAFNATNNTIARLESGDATCRLQLVDSAGMGFVAVSGDNLILANTSSITERLRITSTGQLLFGTSSASNRFKNGNGNGATPKFQFETANVDEQNDISLTYGRNNAFGAEIILAKHRAATVGGHTVVQSGDRLGGINFAGADGTHFHPAALIQARVDGTPGTGDMPGRLEFLTTADGAATPSVRMTIKSDGNITSNGNLSVNNLPGRNLIINGAMQIAQRATSYQGVHNSSSTYYTTVDRMFRADALINANNSTFQHALTSSDTGPWEEGFRYSLMIRSEYQGSVNSSRFISFAYRMEAQDIATSGWNYNSSSSYITLSYWVNSSVSQNYYGHIRTTDGTNYQYLSLIHI